MEMTFNQQYILLYTIYAGIILGVIYDVFRYIRKFFGMGKIWTTILDVLFFALGLLFIWYFFFINIHMNFRFYFIIGVGIGFLLYIYSLSYLLIYLIKKIKQFIIKLRNKKSR